MGQSYHPLWCPNTGLILEGTGLKHWGTARVSVCDGGWGALRHEGATEVLEQSLIIYYSLAGRQETTASPLQQEFPLRDTGNGQLIPYHLFLPILSPIFVQFKLSYLFTF